MYWIPWARGTVVLILFLPTISMVASGLLDLVSKPDAHLIVNTIDCVVDIRDRQISPWKVPAKDSANQYSYGVWKPNAKRPPYSIILDCESYCESIGFLTNRL